MRILFHTFNMGDVDDIEIYVADPLMRWQDTEQGRWVMEHATNVRFFTAPDGYNYGHRVDVIGELEEGPLLTEYLLKWQIIRSW